MIQRRFVVALLLLALSLGAVVSFEAKQNPTTQPSRAVAWGDQVLQQPPAWYASPDARAMADSVIQYQSPQGGWPKSTDLAIVPRSPQDVPSPDDGRANTIDNGATTTPMRFLALVAHATDDSRYRGAFERGVRYLLAAQYPNGGWPQFYPLREGYYSRITFNDDAMARVLQLLGDVAGREPPYALVERALGDRAASAVERGIDIILRTQIRQDGRLTGWCAQYDEVTLAPAWARNYEPPSLSGSETVGIVRFLMGLERPSTAVVDAIEGAVAWLGSVAIEGQRLEEFTNAEGQRDRRVVVASTAGRLWARFYELGTNRPIFTGRDRIIRYTYGEVELERRVGYAYYGTWPARLLTDEYPRWRVRHAARAGEAAAHGGAEGRTFAQKAKVRIMPLGDSITYENHQGDARPTDVRIAYRYRLWELLTQAGRAFDFVGNRNAGMAFFTDPDDADNAGFPGIKTDELAMLVDTGHGGPNWQHQAPGPYLVSHPPDVILLHIGTNGVAPGNWTHVEHILDSIERWEEKPGNHHIITIVARIIDRWPHSADTAAFNDHVEAMVRRRYSAGDDVILVDIEKGAGIDYRLEMDDRLHPRRSGYSKMAAQWFPAVEAVMGRRPYVAIRSPLPGTSYDASTRVTVEADVFHHGGTVNRVEFYLDGVAIGADDSAPYTLDWTPPAGPPRELKAVAIYGGSSRSESRAVVLNPWRILTLGDGITQGQFGHDSYRYPLWKKLLATGQPFRFVGSMALLDGEVLGYWREERKNQVRHEYEACGNQWFDRDRYHEGHWGWRADQIVDGHPLSPDSGRLSDWLRGYTADVALVHAGTADAMQGESAASTTEDLRRIVATLRGKNPRIAVLLAKLIPTADETHGRSIAAVNARLDALAAALSTASSPVTVVDQSRGFDAARDTYDGVHPNSAGEQKLAEAWFGRLAALLRHNPQPRAASPVAARAGLRAGGASGNSWDSTRTAAGRRH